LENMEASGLHEGDEVTVKLIEIDKKTGKFRLSMRALQEKPEGYEERRQNRGPRPGGNGGNGGNRGPRPNGGNRPMGGNRPNGPRRPNRNRRDDRRDDE
ncbi:MAG: polyribonucleotide nucleotidyltransferase, partial [Muribaculaceae bacterium]|nr:polyribonucleotide nucleotidyltransferase [Muribaculaceae bacterium]